jgi:hypothetical protein
VGDFFTYNALEVEEKSRNYGGGLGAVRDDLCFSNFDISLWIIQSAPL